MPSKCLVIQKKCVHGSFRCAQPVLRNHTPAFDLPHRGRRKWLAPRIPLLATIFANSRQLCQIGENLNTLKSYVFCNPIFVQIFCDILLHVDTLHESNCWILYIFCIKGTTVHDVQQSSRCGCKYLSTFSTIRHLDGGSRIRRICQYKISTLPETNTSHLKMDGWNPFFLGMPIFKCELLVLGRVATIPVFFSNVSHIYHHLNKKNPAIQPPASPSPIKPANLCFHGHLHTIQLM